MHDRETWEDFGDFRHGGHRTRRGDIKSIILRVLRNKPMHGYEIISQLEEMSHGMWRPSAGSVYPTLQLLEDQDLVSYKEEDGKKVYTLTYKGKEEVDKADKLNKVSWEEKFKTATSFKDLRFVLRDSMKSVKEIISQNDEKKNNEVRKILTETRDKLVELAEADIIK